MKEFAFQCKIYRIPNTNVNIRISQDSSGVVSCEFELYPPCSDSNYIDVDCKTCKQKIEELGFPTEPQTFETTEHCGYLEEI